MSIREYTCVNFRCTQYVFLSLCSLSISACVELPRSSLHQPPPRAVITGHAPLININIATASELETLPGIGQEFAQRIIEHRTRYGNFRRKEHLLIVRGMGEGRYRKLEPFISVEESNR